MKIFVTKEYMNAGNERVKQLERELERIREEKGAAFAVKIPMLGMTILRMKV